MPMALNALSASAATGSGAAAPMMMMPQQAVPFPAYYNAAAMPGFAPATTAGSYNFVNGGKMFVKDESRFFPAGNVRYDFEPIT